MYTCAVLYACAIAIEWLYVSLRTCNATHAQGSEGRVEAKSYSLDGRQSLYSAGAGALKVRKMHSCYTLHVKGINLKCRPSDMSEFQGSKIDWQHFAIG